SDAARAPHRRDARRHAAALAPAQCRHGDARGLEVSPSSLLQNKLIQRQIGNRLAQPAVLELKVLQALHLLGLQPTELLAPPIIRPLAPPDLADCVRHFLALRDQNIDLPQLRDDLFRLVSLPCHYSPPGCQRHTSSRTTSMGVDHAAFPTNKSSSTKLPPGSTTAMPTTPRPTGNSPPKMLASNLSIYTLQSE